MQNTSHTDHIIRARFEDLRKNNEGALIAYLTGCEPSAEAFRANCRALVEGGADFLEIGIPFSDPIADGPILQASALRALSHGATTSNILAEIGELSANVKIPILVLSYYNPILAMGPESFLAGAHEAGVSGLVIPDLPFEEGQEFGELASKYSIDRILLAAPNTSIGRLEKMFAISQGFLYLVSLYGVTGPRDALSAQALVTVKRVKELSHGSVPISAGFGISSPDQVSALVSSGADGVIVGSSLVNIVAKHLDRPHEAAALLRETISGLKEATRKN